MAGLLFPLALGFSAGATLGGVERMQSPGGSFALSQADIIEAVKNGRAHFVWRELQTFPGVSVFEDALKVDGYRVPVSARTTAAICEILGAVPTTPLIEDVVYNESPYKLKPYAQDVANTRSSVPAFNAALDTQLFQAIGMSAPQGFVSCVGKSWVLSNLIVGRPGKVVNYGMHFPRSMMRSNGPWSSIDQKSAVFQQPGWAHNLEHFDYSQTCRLVKLAPGVSLPSHEPLRVTTLWV